MESSFQPVSLSCPAGVGVRGLCRFPAGGVGVRAAHAVRFGLVAAGRRHGFDVPDPCGRRGAARLRAVGLGRPAPTGCRWRAGMPGCVWCCISLRCSCCSFPDTIRICTEVPKCLSGHCPECRIWCLVVPLPALSGALPCAGCRDVRGALRPASVVRCPDGCGVWRWRWGVLPEPLAFDGRVRFILPAIGDGSFPGLRMAHFGPEVSELEFFIVI